MQRRNIPELLDEDAGTPPEIAGSLADLRSFNRWLGGVRTTRLLIEQVAHETGRREFTLLDVAAGAGYVAQETSRQLQGRGIRLHPTLLDRSAVHLQSAAPLPRIAGDALVLPFQDGSFDLVASSLFLHHLQPAQADVFLS